MAAKKLGLTRDQLASFLGDFEQIKQFEKLFQMVDALAFEQADELMISAGNAQASANDALSQLAQVIDALSVLTTAPVEEHNNSIATDYIDLDTNIANPSPRVGRAFWDGGTTLGVQMTTNVIGRVNEDLFYYIKASGAITKGQAIMFDGAVGSSGVVKGKPATGVTDGSYIMGIAAESIALNGFGLVQFSGTLKGINTSAFTEGDILWYNPAVTGGLTNTKPSAPNVKVQMAAVINSGSGGSGSIVIRVDPGSVLGGTDSNVQFGTLADGDLIQYDSALQYWKNINILGVAHGGTGINTLTAGRLIKGNGTSPVSASIVYDTGSDVGIGGTPTTGINLDVRDGTGATATIRALNTGTAAGDDADIYIRTSSTGVTATSSSLYFGDGDSGTVGFIQYTHSNDRMTFRTGGATAFYLTSAGAGVLTGGLTLGSALTVPNGGTGAATFTANALLKGNGTSAISASNVSDDGTTVSIASGKGFSVARTTVTAPAAGDGNVFSGTYTPTLTNTTNVASSTASACQYMRVGNVVTVSGQVAVTPTATGNTVLGISLPIASNLGATNDLGGTAVAQTTTQVAVLYGDATNDRVLFRLQAAATTALTYHFTFTYRVI